MKGREFFEVFDLVFLPSRLCCYYNIAHYEWCFAGCTPDDAALWRHTMDCESPVQKMGQPRQLGSHGGKNRQFLKKEVDEMKKITAIVLLLALSCLLLTGCFCQHEWKDATCDDPKTCEKCGETEGDELDHEWEVADCVNPKTCSLCGKTRGEALGHTWTDATCETAKTCTVCGETEGKALGHTVLSKASCIAAPKCTVCGNTVGEPLGHDWEAATRKAPKTCTACGETEGEPLDILDIYPEGKPRHDGTKFLMNGDDYVELFGELADRGSYFSLASLLTLPILDNDPNVCLYEILNGTQGQRFRLLLDPDTKQITRIFVELTAEAQYTEEAMNDYILNVVIAYMAANGNIEKGQDFVDHMGVSLQNNSNGTQIYSGCLNGVAYRMEVRYHYMTMEIWVGNE